MSISWDHGREVCLPWRELESWSQLAQIRVYHLGPGNILQELVYSENNDRNSLYYGDLHNLKIVLNPASSSSIAAVRHQDDGICIFFQGQCHNPSVTMAPNDRSVIRPKQWLHSNSTATWHHRRMAKWSGQSRKSSKGLEHRCYHGRKKTCSVSRVLSRSWTTSQRVLLFWEPMDPWWAKFPNVYWLNQGIIMHSRWFRLRYTTAGDPHNCGSRSRWRCGYQCDMERCTGTFCRR